MYTLLSVDPSKPALELQGQEGDTWLQLDADVAYSLNGKPCELKAFNKGDTIRLDVLANKLVKVKATRGKEVKEASAEE